MTSVNVMKTVSAPAAAVWATIREFHGIERYLPAVARSEVTGDGPGAQRTCTLQDGAVLRERLIEIDAAEQRLVYEITESPLPIRGYRCTVRVRDAGQGRCEIEWGSVFEMVDGPSAPFEELFRGAYAAGVDGLERMHRVVQST